MKTFKEITETLASGKSYKQIVTSVEVIAKRIVSKYKDHEAGNSSVPAAPDTTKFMATKSGMIEVVHDITVQQGYFARRCPVFIKLGSNVPLDIRRQIKQEFQNSWEELTSGNSGRSYKTSDSSTLFPVSISGSNWGGIGISVQ